MQKFIFSFGLIFFTLINCAQNKVRSVANEQIAAEIKIKDEHLQAAQFFNTNNPVKVQQLKEVQELLSSILPGSIHDIIFDYIQTDFALQSQWDISKLPLSDVLLNQEFIVKGEYLISYDIKDNKLQFLQKFKAHEKRIYDSFYLKDGRLITYSADATIKIWKKYKESFYLEQVLLGHKGEIGHVIELNDGSLASASDDGTIRIWKEKDNAFKCDQVLRKQTKEILGLMQINNYLLSVSLDHTLCLWQKDQDVWEYKSIVNDAHGSHFFGGAILLLENDSFATWNQHEKVLIWRIDNDELKLLQTIDNKKVNYCYFAKQYLIIRTNCTIDFYENIRGNWEFLTSLTGHLQNNGNNSTIENFAFLQDGRIAIISWEKYDSQTKYYLTIFTKSNLGIWHKNIFYLGEFEQSYLIKVIDNKIVLKFDNYFLILEKSDCTNQKEAINYSAGLIYQDQELIQQQAKLRLQAELVALQAREDNNKAMAEQLKKEQVKQQEPGPQPIVTAPESIDSSDKAHLLTKGKKKKKDKKCVIS